MKKPVSFAIIAFFFFLSLQGCSCQKRTSRPQLNSIQEQKSQDLQDLDVSSKNDTDTQNSEQSAESAENGDGNANNSSGDSSAPVSNPAHLKNAETMLKSAQKNVKMGDYRKAYQNAQSAWSACQMEGSDSPDSLRLKAEAEKLMQEIASMQEKNESGSQDHKPNVILLK